LYLTITAPIKMEFGHSLALVLCVLFALTEGQVPSVALQNAAKPGLKMPVIGIGTGGYGRPGGIDGEYWNDTTAYNAVKLFLAAGGRRIDTAVDYGTEKGIGQAIKESGLAREDFFITSKIGPGQPLGYQETLDEYNVVLRDLQVTYVDLLLIHWPGWEGSHPTDPCYDGQTTWKQCRQDTWRALEYLFNQGKVGAIGVSNFEVNHLQDLIEMGGLIPSVNQNEFHPYWHEDDVLEFCQKHNITYNSYSPLGTPDHMAFHKDIMPIPLIAHPNVTAVAKAVGRSPAQTVLRWSWQQGVVANPRTMSQPHMKENINIFDFELSTEQMQALANLDVPKRKVCGDPHNIK